MRAVLAKAERQGNTVFSAPAPREAFEVWWQGLFGKSTRSKKVAKMAWYAAPREMEV